MMLDANLTDEEGAREIKARIEDYWRARGHEIQVILVRGPFTQALRGVRVDVRSNLINGLPPRARASARAR